MCVCVCTRQTYFGIQSHLRVLSRGIGWEGQEGVVKGHLGVWQHGKIGNSALAGILRGEGDSEQEKIK